jgi:hypothetical protein
LSLASDYWYWKVGQDANHLADGERVGCPLHKGQPLRIGLLSNARLVLIVVVTLALQAAVIDVPVF